MKKFTVAALAVILGLVLMTGISSAYVSNTVQQESTVSEKAKKVKGDTAANNTYNYTHTYFTSNNRQHKFITTYLELTNKKGEAIGVARLVQMGKHVIIKVNALGLKSGKYGFHIQQNSITNSDFNTASPHFNPIGKQHGHDNPNGAVLGDLPNLIANEDRKIDQAAVLEILFLEQGKVSNSILGKSLIIHAKEDDGKADPLGNSGDRAAGGNIPK